MDLLAEAGVELWRGTHTSLSQSFRRVPLLDRTPPRQ